MDVDPATQPVSGGTFDIDFDDDGNPEFRLIQSATVVGLSAPIGVDDAGQSVMGPSGGGMPAAYALSASIVISASATTNFRSVGPGPGGTVGLGYGLGLPWGTGQTDKYLGLKFTLDGGVTSHYGWALLDVAAGSTSFTIKEYCYSDVADGGIHAGDRGAPPEPVGGYVVPVNRLELLGPWLGAAAAGLAGLTAWWRRQIARRGE